VVPFLLLFVFGIFYVAVKNNGNCELATQSTTGTLDSTIDQSTSSTPRTSSGNLITEDVPIANNSKDSVAQPAVTPASVEKSNDGEEIPPQDTAASKDLKAPVTGNEKKADTDATDRPAGKYKVKSKAFFYNEPDESTRRSAFINHWNNATLTPLDETEDFIYIIYTNVEGQTSKGWLRKQDLIRL
jgi:serine/threonine-protein kinase